MITLMTTRFNEHTWNERERWLERNQWVGCIYGTPIRVKDNVSDTMIVLEMHNDANEVKAISLIKNRSLLSDKAHQVYSDRNYNRYIYKSQYRLVLADLTLLPIEKKIIAIFNRLLFKGACHLKRAQGITVVPDWIMKNRQVDFIEHFRAIFLRYYSRTA